MSRDRHLTGSSLVLLVATALGSVLGYGFWLLLARSASPEVVGSSGALVSLLAGIALLATAGIVPTLLVELPLTSGEQRQRLVGTALTAAAGAGTLLAVIALLLSYRLEAFSDLHANTATAVSFVLAGALTPLGAVLDACHVALRRSRGVLVRITATSTVRIGGIAALLVGSRGMSLTSVLALWAGGLLLGAFPSLWSVRRRTGALTLFPLRSPGDLGRRLGWNQVASIAAQLPATLFPLIVVSAVGSAGGAGFYIAWQLAGGCFMVASAVTPSLLSASSDGTEARRAARLTAALLLPAMAVTLVLGGPVLGWLGSDYRDAYPVLAVFVAASAPDAFTSLLVAHWRRVQLERRAAALNAYMAAITIGGSLIVVGRIGAIGVAWSFLAAQASGALLGVLVGNASTGWLRSRTPVHEAPATRQ